MASQEDLDQAYTDTFRALSDPTRLDMFRQIASVDEMPCTVLQGNIGLAKSTISYHIKVLVQAHLISVRKQGRHFFYTARRDTAQDLLPGFLTRVGVPRRPRVTPS
jgi:ArsR family transcriptional regulator, arsenate/arsenite/antimonite-responsive transcriptional repressor